MNNLDEIKEIHNLEELETLLRNKPRKIRKVVKRVVEYKKDEEENETFVTRVKYYLSEIETVFESILAGTVGGIITAGTYLGLGIPGKHISKLGELGELQINPSQMVQAQAIETILVGLGATLAIFLASNGIIPTIKAIRDEISRANNDKDIKKLKELGIYDRVIQLIEQNANELENENKRYKGR